MGGSVIDALARPVAVGLVGAGLALSACGEADPPASRNAEQAFLEAMAPHHTEGAEMARMGSREGETPFVRDLARDNVRTQTSETRRMGRIHQRLFGRPLEPDPSRSVVLGLPPGEAGDSHGQGVVTLRGRRPFDRAFVDAMLPHHRGAIAMADAVRSRAEDEEVRILAREIADTQRREIAAMDAFRRRGYAAPSG